MENHKDRAIKFSALLEADLPFSDDEIMEIIREEINEANYKGLVDQSKKIMKKLKDAKLSPEDVKKLTLALRQIQAVLDYA